MKKILIYLALLVFYSIQPKALDVTMLKQVLNNPQAIQANYATMVQEHIQALQHKKQELATLSDKQIIDNAKRLLQANKQHYAEQINQLNKKIADLKVKLQTASAQNRNTIQQQINKLQDIVASAQKSLAYATKQLHRSDAEILAEQKKAHQDYVQKVVDVQLQNLQQTLKDPALLIKKGTEHYQQQLAIKNIGVIKK